MDQLKRITDLFTEGVTVYLGDQGGAPITVWVNQLNSFEVEEARLDGAMRRAERMSALASESSPERAGLVAELATQRHESIASRYVQQRAEEIMLDVYNDLETNEEYVELQRRCINLPAELEHAASDDPRRAQLAEDQNRWAGMISAARDKAMREAVADATDLERDDLIAAYVEKWREKATIEVFMVERRLTEVWYATRQCAATDVHGDRKAWDHSACDHSLRLCADRPQARALPEAVLVKVSDAIESLRVNPREAGNSDAPGSSSASSEQHAPEAPSMVSIPVAPSSGHPMP